MPKNWKSTLKKIWHFIWDEDSIWSWLVNVIIAFVLIKFLIYPGLGLAFGTSHPVVAVVSGSMEHKTTNSCIRYDLIGGTKVCTQTNAEQYEICGQTYETRQRVDFDFFWEACGPFYNKYDINKLEFEQYPFKNGFNTGDIIVLTGKKPQDIEQGDVVVFWADQADPIIHRVIEVQEGETYFFTTKGDHNPGILDTENMIHQDRIIGKAAFRIPFLGYIKIWFVRLLYALRLDSIVRLFN